jgi:3-phenylpropionate/trans-cinnamate dioxygenase ferredoxin reductase component
MKTPRTVAIVGAGLAGAKTAEALRARGFDGTVTIVGDEPHRPYERPALSKGCLTSGSVPDDELFVHGPTWYGDNDVELLLDCPVHRIDVTERQILAGARTRLPFDVLVLATGCSARRLTVPGAGLSGVNYLRTLGDSQALHATLVDRPRVVIIGGGWIGLEVAAAARTLGAEVTVLEASRLPMGALLGDRVADLLLDAHRSRGVRFLTDARVERLVGDGLGHVTGVGLGDGTTLPADVVLVGIGAVPTVGLAQQAGLVVEDGVVVDAHLRTSHPDVFAVGDIASAWHPTLGARLRVEHWANALNQPQTVAASVTGHPEAYDALPYFFSDQYDLSLEYTGRTDPSVTAEVVLRGDETAGKFTAFWLQRGQLTAAMSVNSWGQTEAVEELIRARATVSASALADPEVPLESLRP